MSIRAVPGTRALIFPPEPPTRSRAWALRQWAATAAAVLASAPLPGLTLAIPSPLPRRIPLSRELSPDQTRRPPQEAQPRDEQKPEDRPVEGLLRDGVLDLDPAPHAEEGQPGQEHRSRQNWSVQEVPVQNGGELGHFQDEKRQGDGADELRLLHPEAVKVHDHGGAEGV